MTVEKMLQRAKELITEDRKDKVILKSFRTKPEWRKLHLECIELAGQLTELKSKITSKRDYMWGMIQEDLGIYSGDLSFSVDGNEINQFEEKDEDNKK